MAFVKYFVVLFVCSIFQISNGEEDLIVELAKPIGKIRGHILNSNKGQEYYAFHQIPYAAPPIGEKRFEPPEMHDNWDGVLDCTKNTRICYQFHENPVTYGDEPRTVPNLRESVDVQESEDCLYLNVYTPVKPGSNNSLSVFLYIHGGGFIYGDGTFYTVGPKYLIDGDIIVVTMNYRLGPLGFLSTGDSVISGNMGLKDQHLALQWTYDNIHLFGGNPKDIVLGGESAGSYSVGHHLYNPKTEGLVSGFVQQSGTALSAGSVSLEPSKYAFELGRVIDPTITRNTSHLSYALKKASPEEIVKASGVITCPISIGFIAGITWTPVIEVADASQPFLTSPVYEGMMKGNFNRLPSFIGFNSEESVVFLINDESLLQKTAAKYDEDPSLLINPVMNVVNRTLVGEKLKEVYTSYSFEKDPDALIRFTSDAIFTRPTIRQTELTSEYMPVYLYELSVGMDLNRRHPGVGHSLDLYYLWDNIKFPREQYPVDLEIAETVLTLWWNFIKYKNPTPNKEPILQNIEWPTVEPDNIRYLDLNKTLSIKTNPRNYNKLKKVLLDYMIPPFYVF